MCCCMCPLQCICTNLIYDDVCSVVELYYIENRKSSFSGLQTLWQLHQQEVTYPCLQFSLKNT